MYVDWIMITHKLQSIIGTHASVSSLCSSYVHVAVMLPSVATGELCYTASSAGPTGSVPVMVL